MRQQQEEQKKLEQQMNQQTKQQKMEQLHQQEDQQRKENSRLRSEQINKVRDQFQKSLIDLNQKYQLQEQSISEMLLRAHQNRTERFFDRSLKSYEHSVKIEETLNNAKRVEKQNELHRIKILQKITDDNEKILKIQNEKREMAKVKVKIQADHEREKQSILKEMNTIQRYQDATKLDKSIYSPSNTDSLLTSTVTTKKYDNFQSASQGQTPMHSSQRQRQRSHNFSLNSSTIQSERRTIKTEPKEIPFIQIDVTPRPRFKQLSEYQRSPQTLSFNQSFMTPSQKRQEEVKRQNMIELLRQHKDFVSKSVIKRNNPQLAHFNESSVIRQRQQEYNLSARHNPSFFGVEFPEKKQKKLDYKSNKLVKNIISAGYINDIQMHQNIICQDMNLQLSKEALAHPTLLNRQNIDDTNLELISKDLLRLYQQLFLLN